VGIIRAPIDGSRNRHPARAEHYNSGVVFQTHFFVHAIAWFHTGTLYGLPAQMRWAVRVLERRRSCKTFIVAIFRSNYQWRRCRILISFVSRPCWGRWFSAGPLLAPAALLARRLVFIIVPQYVNISSLFNGGNDRGADDHTPTRGRAANRLRHHGADSSAALFCASAIALKNTGNRFSSDLVAVSAAGRFRKAIWG
jgi:hypothetical protein